MTDWKAKYFELYDKNIELLRKIERRDEEIVDLMATMARQTNRIAELEATLDSIRCDPNWAVDLSYEEGVE